MENMSSKQAWENLSKLPAYFVFFLSLYYWTYLAATTQMVNVYDAYGYQLIGQLTQEGGLSAFFKAATSREPLYCLFVAFCHVLGKALSVSSLSLQVIFQVLFLCMTQIMTWLILKKLNIHSLITFFVLLYIGFSPALVNSALSSFSEIISYPFILGIILSSLYIFDSLKEGRMKVLCVSSLLLAMQFVMAVFVKGVFQYIFYIYLIPFLIIFLKPPTGSNIKRLGLAIFLVIMLGVFELAMISYNALNVHYTGEAAGMANRGYYSLYNSAALRTDPESMKLVTPALASIPGGSYCVLFFGQEVCQYWATQHLESYAEKDDIKVKLEGKSQGAWGKVMRDEAQRKISERPWPFLLFMGLDAVKLFFFETTQMGFVVYPDWLEDLYGSLLYESLWKFPITFMAFFSIIYLSVLVIRKKRLIFSWEDEEGLHVTTALFLLIIICTHIGVYALLAASIPRHVLPIVPLFLIAIAITFHRLFASQNSGL